MDRENEGLVISMEPVIEMTNEQFAGTFFFHHLVLSLNPLRPFSPSGS